MASGDVRVSRGTAGWRVELEGSDGTDSLFATQADAWETGKALARERRVEAILYGRDGRIREVHGPGVRRARAA